MKSIVDVRKFVGTSSMLLVMAAAVFFACDRQCLADPVLDLLPAQASSGTSWSQPTFGQTITGTLASGTGSYFGTYVTGTPSGSGGGAQLGTWATVTQFSGTSQEVTMAWRTRTLSESFAAEPGAQPTSPPLDFENLFFGLSSDVLRLDGLNEKLFLLQMSYETNSAWYDEATEASLGCILIQWYDPSKQLWVDASLGNSSNDPNRRVNYQGSWAAAGSPMTLGSYGVDTVNNVAWAILDHNSDFAVAPEPGASSLMALGGSLVALMLHVRRRRSRPARS